jgi:hypothetical protein
MLAEKGDCHPLRQSSRRKDVVNAIAKHLEFRTQDAQFDNARAGCPSPAGDTSRPVPTRHPRQGVGRQVMPLKKRGAAVSVRVSYPVGIYPFKCPLPSCLIKRPFI